MIKKRITKLTKLVSEFDEAYVRGFDEDQRKEYLETLDIEKLEGLKNLTDMPTIFVVHPLKAEYEYLVNDGYSNPWHIFATHIDSIEHFELDDGEKLEFNKGVLNDKHHNDFPLSVIQDIAHKIVSIARQTSNEVFFTQSVASQRFCQALKMKDALNPTAEIALMAAVKNNSSK